MHLKVCSIMREEFLEILVEEKSMEFFLQGFLPNILPQDFILYENCRIRAHNGKQDLQSKIPILVKGYKNYPWPVRLLIIQDQDSENCIELKYRLLRLIEKHNAGNLKYLVRIACRELENWYLGDLHAVEKIYPRSRALRNLNKAKYRNSDNLQGADEMAKFSNEFEKVICARMISSVISLKENRSKSFQHFCSGLERLITLQ